MKKILLSLLISFVLIVGVLVAGGILVVVTSTDMHNLNRSTIAMVDKPFRLPKYIYYRLYPPTAEDFSTDASSLAPRRAVLGVALFVANVLLYSVPAYLLLLLLGFVRKERSAESHEGYSSYANLSGSENETFK